VAKYAGLKWRKTQSGEFQAEETRLTRTGRVKDQLELIGALFHETITAAGLDNDED